MYQRSHKIIPACLNILCLNLWVFTPVAKAACPEGTVTANGKFVVSGVSVMEISSYMGSAPSIDIDLGMGIVPSGPISFTLDTSQTNVILYNFDSGYATLNINLLVDTPLLSSMGESPASLNLIESALLPAFNIVMPSVPPASTNTSFVSDGFASQPLLPAQALSFTGMGSIAPPTGDYKTLEFTGSDPLVFFGGGQIISGTLAGFSYYSANGNPPIIPYWFASISALTTTIPNPPPNQPPNSPPPEFTEPIPNFPAYPTLPQPVEMCSVPEPSYLLGLISMGVLGVNVILTQKNKVTLSS